MLNGETNMDHNTFWAVISEVNKKVGQIDRQKYLFAIIDKLQEYSPQEIAQWKNIQQYYIELAYTSGIQGAADLILDGVTGDSFIYFRLWLIAQGKSTYAEAISNPDSLDKLSCHVPKQSQQFESFWYAANDAYDMKVCYDSVYDEMKRHPLSCEQRREIKAELEFFSHDIQSLDDLALALPKLYLRFGDTLDFGLGYYRQQ